MCVYPELVACALWVIDPIGRRVDCYRVGEEDGHKDFRSFENFGSLAMILDRPKREA